LIPSPRSPKLAAILKDLGALFRFLSPFSPDLDPNEMAFAKLKALIRKTAIRPFDQLWKAVANVRTPRREDEFYNIFKVSRIRNRLSAICSISRSVNKSLPAKPSQH